MNILGVDPGATGALAVISQNKEYVRVFSFADMTERQVADFFESQALDKCHCFLERVHAFPGQGVSAMFTFGRHYGFVRACLISQRIPFDEVDPPVWQRGLSLGRAFPTKAQRKTAHYQKAQQLYPHVNMKKPAADALLIAEYGHRVLFR